MKLQDLFESNDLLPKKVLAILAARFFDATHRELETLFNGDPKAEAMSDEINFDVEDHPSMRFFVTYPRPGVVFPRAQIRKIVANNAKKFKLHHLGISLDYDSPDVYSRSLDFQFTEPMELDDAALERGEEEFRKLGTNELKTVTLNF